MGGSSTVSRATVPAVVEMKGGQPHQRAHASLEDRPLLRLFLIGKPAVAGAAMMSVLALAAARIKGLSVVTPSGAAHQQLLANEEEAVFEKLLEIPRPGGAATGGEVMVEELSHVVITIGFDLTRLTADQICELLKRGKDLRSFRAAVGNFASRIPPGLDQAERQKRLRQEAEAVLEEWNGYTRDLPSFAKEALVDAALDKVSDKAIELGAQATVAAALGVLPGC